MSNLISPLTMLLRGGRVQPLIRPLSWNSSAGLSNHCRDRFNWSFRLREPSTSETTCHSQHSSTLFQSVIRSFSTYTCAVENEDEAGHNVSPSSPRVEISKNGQHLSIMTTIEGENTATTFTFLAPLLWVNDPQYIHSTSGQRLRTLGQYRRSEAILHGEVFIEGRTGDDTDLSSALHPPPLRGSFHSRGGIYALRKQYNNASTETSIQRKILRIKWRSGEMSHFDMQWLLDHASLGRLGRKQALEECSQSDDGGSEMKSYVGTSFQAASDMGSNTTRVTKHIAIGSPSLNEKNAERSIPTVDYHHVMEDEEMTFLALRDIFEHGAILVQNAPDISECDLDDKEYAQLEQESIVGNLGKKFAGGKLSHGSLYGDIFHVRSKRNAENIAYTNVALPPHQDLTYYESKPFLQLLHCVHGNDENGGIVGGESVLIDAMAAAEELRLLASDLFDILCQTEATFLKQREGADMVSPKPHIVTDPALGHVVEINWSPPFEGPMQLHAGSRMQDYVRAYQAFECMVNDQWRAGEVEGDSLLSKGLEYQLKAYATKYTWQATLQKGEILVFNNQRMLHGRRNFEIFGEGRRHLIGCYTDAMDTASQYRQMMRERGATGGRGYGKRNPGSGCRWL